MKMVVLALAMLQSFSASATSLRLAPKTATGTQITAVPALNENANVAVTTIDQENGEIVVQLFNDMCGQLLPVEPGVMRCMAAAQLVKEYSAPIISQTTGACGETVIKASIDARPVDGALNEITVTDNSTLICDIFPPAPTVIDVHSEFVSRMQHTTIVRDISIQAGPLK